MDALIARKSSQIFMFSQINRLFIRRTCLRNGHPSTLLHRFCSSAAGTSDQGRADNRCLTNAEALFIRPDVQSILKKITGFNLDKIFRVRQMPDIETPKYKLLTEAQLKELEAESVKRAEKLLQMPPVKNPWTFHDDSTTTEVSNILSEDNDISHFSDISHYEDIECRCRYVFTDITYDLPHRDRAVVVRESGSRPILRHADLAERDRILQVYFPRDGRMYKMPKMFEEQRLEKILAEFRYEYVLDRACIQFEPDDPEYIRVTHRTYEHIASHKKFDDLRSTRHFGPMTFYLTLNKKIAHVLVDMIQRDLITDAEELVRLFHILHPESSSAVAARDLKSTDPQSLIQLFVKHDSREGGLVELALQAYNQSQETLQTKSASL